MSNLGNKVNSLRKEKGWSLNELSLKTNIPVSTLHGIEKGSKPSFDKITKLSKVLGVELSDLLKDSGYKEITNLSTEDKSIYLDFLAPTEDYKEYIAAFEYIGYEVYEHIGPYTSSNKKEGYIYDIKFNDKVLITLDLDGFSAIGKMVLEYKKTFEKSLNLLIQDTITNWSLIYDISEEESKTQSDK